MHRLASQPARRRATAAGIALAVLSLLPACGGGQLELSTDSAGTALYEQGMAAYENEDWRRAVEAFDTLLNNYPASPYLAEARLHTGLAQYEMGHQDNLVLAIEAFQNFLTYHPTHEQSDLAQLMIGKAYARQMRDPDRDQGNTEKTVESFETFLEEYPDSEHAEEARQLYREAKDRLVRHELGVARWQISNDLYTAARDRILFAMERYPDTALVCDLTFLLAEALRGNGATRQAMARYREVVENHPDCELAADARQRLREHSPEEGPSTATGVDEPNPDDREGR